MKACGAKQDEPARANGAGSGDWFLQTLVRVINGTEESFEVTLNSGGMLISGNLVSGHKYFEEFGKNFAKGLLAHDKETADNVLNSFSDLGNRYLNRMDGEVSDNELLPPLHYLHLKNVKFYQSGGAALPAKKVIWWRGRIDRVDGFVLGGLSRD